MVRRVLITALISASVLGPQWCCCSIGAVIRGAAGPAESAAAAPAPQACECCTACTEASRIPAEKDSPERDGHSCPCREHRKQVVANASCPLVAADSQGHAAAWGGIAIGFAPLAVESAAVTLLGIAPSGRPASLSGRALLRAYGIMRC